MVESGRRRVLVIDDDPQVRNLFADYLEGEYEVHLAESGAEALDALDDDIDVVLLDRRMPTLPGEEVLEHIRESGFDVPVALVTAVDPDFDVLEMGFDDYVVKPVGADELVDVVETLLLRREYDDVIRKYFSLVSKVANLRQTKSPEELEANAQYRETEAELEELKAHARTSLDAAIEAGKFDELFRDLSPSEPSSQRENSVLPSH